MPEADRAMTKPKGWSAAAAAADRALPPGTRIDDYEIEQTLVEGVVAIVYRAFDHALGMQVAIEEYMPEAMALRSADGRVVLRTRIQGHAFDEGRQAFVGEAQTLARCEHPSLLRIDRIVQRNGTVYRAMRLNTGPTLLEHRRALDAPPDAATLQRWLEDLLGALAALHAEGCVHGAVAPERIVLRDDGHLLLLGFDAVRARLISGRTQDMMAALEPSFAAPELRNPSPGQASGPWTDLYALATTLRFCIDGELPPPASGPAAAQPARQLSEAWQRAPHEAAADAAWLRAVDACLAEAPQDRPQSVAALRRMIDEAMFASTLAAWPAPRIAAAPSNDATAVPAHDAGAGPAAPPASAAGESAKPAEPTPVAAAAAEAVAAAAAVAAADARPAADAPITVMLADLEQTLARVSEIAGEEAEQERIAAQNGAAAAAAPASESAAGPAASSAAAQEQRVAPPSQQPPAQGPAAWQRELRWLWQRNPVAWLAAAVVAVTAVVLLLMRDERQTAELTMGDVQATAPVAAPTVPAIQPPSPPAPPPPPVEAPLPQVVAAAALGTDLDKSKAEPAAGEGAARERKPVAPEPKPAAPEPKGAAPQPAAKPAAVAHARPAPRAGCTGKSGYALYECMQTQCAKRNFAKHPQCVHMRKTQSLN